MGMKTDSTPVAEPKNPEKCNVLALLRLFAAEDELAEVERKYREGGIGYGTVKKRLVELVLDYFGAARVRRAEMAAHPELVAQALALGAEKARASARRTMAAVRRAVGVGE